MSVIVDRCPFHDTETRVETPFGPVTVRAYQIVLWASLSLQGVQSRRFPVVVDTGHTHNFSIREEHLRQWAGVAPEEMRIVGTIHMNERRVFLREAQLVLHRNVPGKRDEVQGDPYPLELSQGIVVIQPDEPIAVRLPALGLRAITRNRLVLTVDGRRQQVSLDSWP